MNIKLIISGIVILLLYALIGYLTTRVKKEPTDVAISLALVILGATVGWVIGIFLTPYPGQKTEFVEYASLVTLFTSGYLVGKVDAAISHLFKPENLFTPIVGFRVVITFASLLLGMLITVAIRHYLYSGLSSEFCIYNSV